MHLVYILYNPIIDKYYIGETENIERRIMEHNTGFFEKSYTAFNSGWELKRTIKLNDRTNARKIESYIKNMKSKKYQFNLISDEAFYKKFINIVHEKFDIIIID